MSLQVKLFYNTHNAVLTVTQWEFYLLHHLSLQRSKQQRIRYLLCPALWTPIHTLTHLYKTVHTLTHPYKLFHNSSHPCTAVLFQTLTHLYKPIQTLTHLYTPVHTRTHQYKLLHNCTHPYTPIHTYHPWYCCSKGGWGLFCFKKLLTFVIILTQLEFRVSARAWRWYFLPRTSGQAEPESSNCGVFYHYLIILIGWGAMP